MERPANSPTKHNFITYMNKARFSLLVFGLYMIFVVGLGFMLIPPFVLNLFGPP